LKILKAPLRAGFMNSWTVRVRLRHWPHCCSSILA